MFHRHIKDPTRLRVDRQEDRISLLAFLAQAFQHDGHDIVIPFGRTEQRLVEPARAIEFRGRDELVLEPERVEETAQHRVVVVTEAVMGAERIGHLGQRLLQMLAQRVCVGQRAGNLAHPVQIVRKADQPCGDVRDHLERAADHRGARYLAECSDMRQATGAIAGLEQDMTLCGGLFLEPFDQLARFLERPRLRSHRNVTQVGHRFLLGRTRVSLLPGPPCVNYRRTCARADAPDGMP